MRKVPCSTSACRKSFHFFVVFHFPFYFVFISGVCAVWHGLCVFTVYSLSQQWMSPSSFRFPCALCSTNFAWMRNGNWYAVDWHGVTLCCNTERLSSTNVYSNFRCIFEMIKLPPLPQRAATTTSALGLRLTTTAQFRWTESPVSGQKLNGLSSENEVRLTSHTRAN